MCGIFGILAPEPIDIDIQKINDLQWHRGPDDSGIYRGDGIALAARRLSIIDLEGGHQPLSNENGRLWLACNGEIVNASDLRSELENDGHVFRTRTDIEAILHGYEEWGEMVITRLRGMFAFALWDSTQRKLFLGRDRFGIKPLNYASAGMRFAFGSEILPILEALPEIQRRAEPQALWRLFELGFIPSPLTMFQGVNRLPAAHWMTVENGSARTVCYWKPSYPRIGEHSSVSLAGASEAFVEKLSETIAAWRLSDVPVGSLLSSGIDSSSLAAILNEINGEPIHTFNLAFSAPSLDESLLARTTANLIGSQHHEMRSDLDSLNLLPSVLNHLEEPHHFTSVSMYLIFQGCQEAGFKVVMTGEGCDELLGGYPWYQFDKRIRKVLWFSQSIRSLIAKSPFVASRDVKRLLQFGTQDIFQRSVLYLRGFRPEEALSLLNCPSYPSFHQVLQAQYSADLAGLHPFDQMLFIESRTRLVDFINFGLDRMSMANSVEARPAFLDHLLWEFTASLPPSYKLNPQGNKYLLRRGMRGRLPPEVLGRPKKGLTSLQNSWWRKPRLPDWAEECLTPASLSQAGYFSPQEVVRLRRLHRSGERNLSNILVSILCVQLWHQIFINNTL
jgi:asparagine synthase (glutamine-hydrolysing)